MLRKFTAFSPTVKNRYEILFFNKEALCAMMSSIKNNNSSSGSSQNNNSSSGSLNPNSQQNNNNNLNVNNTPLSELKSELNKLSPEDFDAIGKKIENINIKGCKIDFKKDDIINYYNILKDCSYLRLYFKYTDDTSLAERFKENGKKDFNYVQKYNISIFKMIIDLFRIKSKKELNYKEIENNYNKLDKSTQKKIDTILNRKVNSDEKHYTNIKEVLKIIETETGGSINYCIILDIKKSKLMSINSITKKTNSNNKTFNNKTFQTGGGDKINYRFLMWMYFYYYFWSMTSKKTNSMWYCLSKVGMKGKKTAKECMNIK